MPTLAVMFWADPSTLQPGLDPEKVQQDLARVAVHLQEPEVLPPGAVRLSWTVSAAAHDQCRAPSASTQHPSAPIAPQVQHQAPFLQGYRVLLRRRGGRWEDARVLLAPGDRGVLLTDLRRGQHYEVKVQPFFHHLHGPDSAVRTLSTPEAGESGWMGWWDP